MKRRKKVVLLLSLFVLFTLLLLVPEKQESATSAFDGTSVPRGDGYYRCICPRQGGVCGCVYHSED